MSSALPSYQRPVSLKPEKENAATTHPDELFTRYSVPEVKAVVQKLRFEADQKRQELRLMVGERYRDILQASASIISIANSSKRVIQALDESKMVILNQDGPPYSHDSPTLKETDHLDTHLHVLQQLTAHIKVLLDAPEHLWRLIEGGNYLTATWLFLLTRVVHKALVRNNDQDEGVWKSQGIDVMSEFPLVQRQWDVISQFRSQIIHKATLSLRDSGTTSEATCAALMTLHLLDSRPLTETLGVYLSQRSKTLVQMLSRNVNQPNMALLSTNDQDHNIASASLPTLNSQVASLQEVKEAIRAALAIVMQTVKSARDLFDQPGSSKANILHLLQSMHPDIPKSQSLSTLPPELFLDTPSVLSVMLSSTQFQFLPPEIRSYKPYVDLGSDTALILQTHVTNKVGEWFGKSLEKLENSISQWLAQLQHVKDVWSVRSSVWRWITISEMREEEISLFLNTLDKLFSSRIENLWKNILLKMQHTFKEQLDLAMLGFRSDGDDTIVESPTRLLFQAPSLPQQSQLGFGLATDPFEKYHAALRKQLLARTHMLDLVLSILENCASSIQDDIRSIFSSGKDKTR
ncbi:hypothetical protein AMATHDRAFT_147119 [Amanita thiersii Skay4041]|uniref:Conserved oligomeric Golgi complex subunit 1 n=1 Tax=Amanita thiersii Skay4041 TaxID=703135 RepID=A0A2A9NPQ4_9AGAR|nr:hypothetical protein AMATHDRAFT_147119 [Amanita thiersii Skay4041]